MDISAIDKAIRDCGLPGRLVELDGRTITLDLLNDRLERLERHQLGVNQFCDLLLDWRQKLISRDPDSIVAAKIAQAQGERRPEPAGSRR
ncbi:MAG: hypothetical protein ACR2MY_02370 [Candidatus Dormibacteria bacterium]